jgi:hypothetical protein
VLAILLVSGGLYLLEQPISTERSISSWHDNFGWRNLQILGYKLMVKGCGLLYYTSIDNRTSGMDMKPASKMQQIIL